MQVGDSWGWIGVSTVLTMVGLFVACTPASQHQPSQIDRITAEPEPSTLPGPPPPPAGAYLAQIPPDITGELEALGIPIVVPTYLPMGFDLVDYTANPGTIGSGHEADYWLVYRDDTNRCFSIEYSPSQQPQENLPNRLPIKSPLFGSDYSLYYETAESNGSESTATDTEVALDKTLSPFRALFSDWLAGEQGFYRLVGAALTMASYRQSDCLDLPPAEAVKVLESLTSLQGEITGDG